MREPLLPLIASLCWAILAKLSGGVWHTLEVAMTFTFAFLCIVEIVADIRERAR